MGGFELYATRLTDPRAKNVKRLYFDSLSDPDLTRLLHLKMLTIAAPRWGVNIHPSIFSIAQKPLHKLTQTFQYLIWHQFGVYYENLRKIRRDIFLENGVLVTSYSAIFSQKTANV